MYVQDLFIDGQAHQSDISQCMMSLFEAANFSQDLLLPLSNVNRQKSIQLILNLAEAGAKLENV